MSLPFTPVLHPAQERPLRNRPEPEEPQDEAEVEAEAEAELDEDEIPRWLESQRIESEGGLSLHEINQLPGGICSGCADAEAEAILEPQGEANSEAEGELDADQIARRQEEMAEEGHHFGEGRWGEMRRAAYSNQRNQAVRMQVHASEKDGDLHFLDIGSVVRLSVPKEDRSKLCPRTVLAAVVEHKWPEGARPEGRPNQRAAGTCLYRLVTRDGVLQCLYARYKVQAMPHATLALVHLTAAVQNWKTMKTIGLRQCMRKASVMGGQGFGLCKCTGPCKKNSRCSCRKANRLCTRRCHTKPYKHSCTNCEEFHDDEEEEPRVDAEEEAELWRLEGGAPRAPLGPRNVRVPSCSCKQLCRHKNCACKRAKRPCTEHCHRGSECFNRSEIEAAVQDFMESISEDGSDPEWRGGS